MPPSSPWKTLREAGDRIARGPRVLRRAVAAGRLRAVIISGKRECLTRDEWVDAYLLDLERPITVIPRRRTG
jgi:hypothetical protein